MRAYKENRTQLVEDLINTYDTYLAQPEHLQAPADLEKFLKQRRFRLDSPVTLADLNAVRERREELRQIWNTETVEALASPLNALLRQTGITPQVHAETDEKWHVDYSIDEGTTLIDRLTAESALGILTALEQHGIERLRSCASSPCRDVFVDTTRNRSRRFCSDRCANRYNIAAFRERQSTDPNEN